MSDNKGSGSGGRQRAKVIDDNVSRLAGASDMPPNRARRQRAKPQASSYAPGKKRPAPGKTYGAPTQEAGEPRKAK